MRRLLLACAAQSEILTQGATLFKERISQEIEVTFATPGLYSTHASRTMPWAG